MEQIDIAAEWATVQEKEQVRDTLCEHFHICMHRITQNVFATNYYIALLC
jgi:hypothetical protein